MAYVKRSDHGLDSGRELDWRQEAACADYNLDWWNPTSIESDGASWAAYVCHDCPVMRQCHNWASTHLSLCGGAIYAGVYYAAKSGQAVRPSLHQPVPRQPPDVRALLKERFGSVAALEREARSPVSIASFVPRRGHRESRTP